MLATAALRCHLQRHRPNRCCGATRPWPFITQAMLAGTIVLAVAVTTAGEPGRWRHCRPVRGCVVIYLGMVGGALAFWLWNFGLERTTPTRVAVTVAVNPIVAAVLGMAVLGEPIAATLAVGLVAVLAGIALTAWPARQPQRLEPVQIVGCNHRCS